MKDDTISRAAVMDTLNGIEISRNASWYEFYQKAITAVGTLPPAQQIPWNRKTRNSMVNTLQMLRRLAYNIHGVMDVIDDDNVRRLIEWLEGGEP